MNQWSTLFPLLLYNDVQTEVEHSFGFIQTFVNIYNNHELIKVFVFSLLFK